MVDVIVIIKINDNYQRIIIMYTAGEIAEKLKLEVWVARYRLGELRRKKKIKATLYGNTYGYPKRAIKLVESYDGKQEVNFNIGDRKMGHTEGEWAIKQTRGNNRHEYTLYHGVGTAESIIAEIKFIDNKSSIANARLIAAAPELLDSCKILTGLLSYWMPRLKEIFKEDILYQAQLSKARRIIAKATQTD